MINLIAKCYKFDTLMAVKKRIYPILGINQIE